MNSFVATISLVRPSGGWRLPFVLLLPQKQLSKIRGQYGAAHFEALRPPLRLGHLRSSVVMFILIISQTTEQLLHSQFLLVLLGIKNKVGHLVPTNNLFAFSVPLVLAAILFIIIRQEEKVYFLLNSFLW
jgi:hypothetical protein